MLQFSCFFCRKLGGFGVYTVQTKLVSWIFDILPFFYPHFRPISVRFLTKIMEIIIFGPKLAPKRGFLKLLFIWPVVAVFAPCIPLTNYFSFASLFLVVTIYMTCHSIIVFIRWIYYKFQFVIDFNFPHTRFSRMITWVDFTWPLGQDVYYVLRKVH